VVEPDAAAVGEQGVVVGLDSPSCSSFG
ncbi:hypothetical protein A2U01_0115059, partial [Trifolium medium]|nr:hypothetical protein [Trifolium medium]